MLDLVLRSMLTPGVLAARWIGLAHVPELADLPRPPLSIALATKMALDELFFLTEALSIRLVSLSDRARIGAEVAAALEFLDSRGFLAAPERYHLAPPPLVPQAAPRRT
jgi:hypothetical protein